jgi:hypothetical protein
MNKFSHRLLIVASLLLTISLFYATDASAQINGQPPEGVSCVVTAGNRNAPLAIDGSYTIFGIPGNLGAIRARTTCSDGSVGQSAIGFTDPIQSITIPLGPIEFGILNPVPIAVNLSANESRLSTGDSSQLTLQAVAVDGSSRDVSNRSEGTVYSISNQLLGTITDNGLVNITSQFDTSSSARLVASATSEGSVSSTYMYVLGPLGTLRGIVYQPDGITPVANVQVSVLRLQPMQNAGTTITDVNGRFELAEVNAGSFMVSAIDPLTGNRALSSTSIRVPEEIAEVSLTLNGQGQVNVTVINDNNEIVSGSEVSLTALGAYHNLKTAVTNSQGIASFTGVVAGDFTVSTRDPATGLLGALFAHLNAGETLDLSLMLQQTGSISGVVYDTDGATLVSGVQVRLLSRQRGVISQSITQAGGFFSFDTLPKSDGPFILDAFVDGRLRARVPGIVFSVGEEVLERNINLSSVGVVTGTVRSTSGDIYPSTRVSMQSLEGLRLNFDALTDDRGQFVLPAVPLGDFELTAVTTNGLTGRATGRINTDNEIINLDVVLASNTIVGTVYQRGGVTPVGAGVDVYLAPRTTGKLYSYANSNNVIVTQTDGDGRYGFAVAQTGDFYVQAESGLDRGRSRAVLINLNPAQPLETNIVFLAKGSVSGVVTDANGVVQSNAVVSIITEGAFDVSRQVLTDGNGHYFLDGVFAGDIVVQAKNNITQQVGVRQGRIDAEGQQLVIDVVLAASGSVQGQILQANGSVVDQAVNVKLFSNNILFTSFNLDNGNLYQVDLVPLGDVKIIAEELGTGNKGISTTRIDSLNETKIVNVHLIGQGTLNIDLVDNNGAAVIGAKITVLTQQPFNSRTELISDENGNAVFTHVFAGDYVVSASKDLTFGSLQGSTNGTLLADEEKQISIQMDAVAVGSISGVVYKSDGITPQGAGWVVRMLPEPYTDAYITITNELGEYSFNQVNAGTYNIDALAFFNRQSCPISGRIRARASGVSLTTQDEQVMADLQFIGSGEVFGVVTNDQEQPVSGITVTLTSPDPIYGFNSTCSGRTTYITTTNALGEYQLVDIPAGNFTLLAENSDRTLRAQGNDRIKFDMDSVELNLALINNVVTMPYNFYDANGFLYDINGNGSIGSGTQSVFAAPAPDNAGMRLEIVNNNIAVPFLNGDGTLGKLINDGQGIEVDDTTPSGLFISRRIYMPHSGYFSRYLEVLENPTNQAITVDVKVKSYHRTDDSNPRVVDSSDGDQVLSVVNPLLPDRWIVIDDQTDADPFENNSIPATGHVFDGPDASTQVASASYDLIGQTGRLTYQWDNITVDAGQKVILMHFTFGQIQRAGARQAATRLDSLPPETIDDLTTEDRNAIINFNVPQSSQLAALPNLSAGQLSGQVLSGDGITRVPNATVKFQSQQPLFGRIRYINSGANGLYEFHSTLDGTAQNYVIPVDAFNISANYALTGAQSAITPSDFPMDTTQTTQDIIFIGKGDVKGSVLRHNGATVAGTKIVMCEIDNRNACFIHPDNKTTSAADGNYVLYANTPRDYFIFADKSHPQAYLRNLQGQATVTATAADVTVANIVMEETGSISGKVRAADGTPVSEAEVVLYDLNGTSIVRIRRTYSDTAGFYRLFDVPLGQFEVRARDVISNATGQANVQVVVDQESTQDIDLLSTATLNVMVQYERGVFANNAEVNLTGSIGSQRVFTDSNGLAQFQLPAGLFNITAKHPDRGSPLIVSTSVEILVSDDIVNRTLVLPAAGEVSGTILRPDGTTLAGGFPYSITQIRGLSIGRLNGYSDGIGAYRVVGLPLGDYVITAFDAQQDRFADAEFSVNQDGQELLLDLNLLDERIALPADLLDANRFIYDIQQDGRIQSGNDAFSTGGNVLLIDNQVFTGDTSARLQAGKRQFAINQAAPMSGLDVTRKIYVPRGSYFARYIEVLDNPTNADITVDVKLQHGFNTGEFIKTSSQDIQLSTQDNWVLIDDDADEDVKLFAGQMPATAHVFDDASQTLPASLVDISYSNLMATVQQQWSAVTIPAGQKVSLMHVMVQQINRVGAEYAATRLAQMPPELLTDLTNSEIATIINFNVPTDGVSALESLPPLTGSISGQVFEGSDSNPIIVPSTKVTVQSLHPLFSRVWGKISDSFPCPGPGTGLSSLNANAIDASYGLQGQLTDIDSIAIPLGVTVNVRAQEATPCYVGASGHPFTNAPSRVVTVEASAIQDVIFDTSVVTGTVTGTANFAVTSGRLYLSIDNPDFPDFQYVNIAADGSYVYPGLIAGNYDLLFNTTHPDRYNNNDLLRGSKKGVSVPFREVLVSDVLLQATGSVQGAVLAFDSSPAVNAEIILSSTAQEQDYDQCISGCDVNTLEKHKGKHLVSRKVLTDSQGLYNFSAVPTGQYSMQVTDPVSGGTTQAQLTVIEGQVSIQNIVLTAVGSATITVKDVSDNPIIDSFVYLTAETDGTEIVVGRTDFQGQLVVANIPVGNYDIRISDPRAPTIRYMDRSISGNIAAQGQANSHQLTLRAAAHIELTVINSDDAGNPVANADITIVDAIGTRAVGHTDVQGVLLIPVVPEGMYTITASILDNVTLNEQSLSGQVNGVDDNTQISLTIDLRSRIAALPISLKDANNRTYTVDGNEGSQYLPRLLINGETFMGEQMAVSDLSERQFQISGLTSMSGLNVLRKLYVPNDAYFIRYLEEFNNSSANAITVNLEIETTINSRIILDSSNGDAILDAGANPDLWFTSGFNSTTANAFAFISSGENAVLPAPVLSHTSIDSTTRKASAQWSTLTIPANSRVKILHFYTRQSSSVSATASAQRLVQLPPETLTGLNANDVTEIVNFNIPIDLTSQLENLPELTGTISGQVFEGDGVTPINYQTVTVTSNHLLFNNTYAYPFKDIPTLETDENGQFSIAGDLINGNFPIAIPVDGSFTLSATHSISALNVAVDVAFVAGETSLTQDLIFATGSVQGTVSGAFRPNSNFTNRIYVIQNDSNITQKDANLDGSYAINGLKNGSYRLEARTGDFTGRLIGLVENVPVTVGNTTTQNVVYPENGAVAGQVFSNTGIEQPNQLVELTQSDSAFKRSTTTDAVGGYEFGAVPIGNYLITAINSDTQAGVTQTISISDHQLIQQDLTLFGTGTVTINLFYKAGGVIADRAIYIESPAINGRKYLGQTDAAGVLIAEISEGPYTLISTHPLTGQEGSVTGVVNFANEESSIDLILPVSANIQFHVTDRDSANAPIQGVKIRITDINDSGNTTNATTDSNGFDTINNLIQSTYLVFVEVDNKYESSFLFEITGNDDGLTLDKDISFAESQHILNDFKFDQEHYLYQIPMVIGQTLSLSLRHIIADFSCSININVYDPTGNFIAQGVGGVNGQSNQQARIDQLPVLINGRYTLEISPFYANCFSGFYRLSASIDGQSIAIESYQDGGQVSGTIFEADGTTPIAGETISLTTNGPGPIYNKQLVSDANGSYNFDGVPVGDFELIYVPRPSVSATGTISSIGEQIIQDLILSQTTILDIHVLNADGTPIDRQARLDINALGEPRFRPYTNFEGQYTYTYFGFEELSIGVSSPSNSQIIAHQFVQPANGQTIVINLLLIPGVVGGVIYQADGITVVPNATVSAYYANNNKFIKNDFANAQGVYQFDYLPIDNEIVLKVQDPVNGVETSISMATSSQAVNQDIILLGTGTVFGRLSGIGNAPKTNTYIRAEYLTDLSDIDSFSSLETETNANGEYIFLGLPLGRTITIRYEEYTDFGEVNISDQTTLVNLGDSQEVNLSIPGSGITFQILTADGLPIGGHCDVNLNVQNLGVTGLYGIDCGTLFSFIGIPDSIDGNGNQVTLEVLQFGIEPLFSGLYTLPDNQLLEITKVFSVLKGTVNYYDMSNAPFAQLYVEDKQVSSNENGQYRIVGLGQGAFRITAEDDQSSLQTTIVGEIIDEAVPQILDIRFPASGTINGQVLDVDGSAMANIDVYASSSNSSGVQQSTSDNNGQYEITHIVTGEIELSAVNQSTKNIATSLATLTTDQEIQTHDIQFQSPGSVSGTVNDENALTVADACVQMQYTKSGTVHQSLDFSTTSDVNGLYTFGSAADGEVLLTAKDECNSAATIAGLEQATVINNANSSVDLQYGNALPLNHELNKNGSNFAFNIAGNGSVQTKYVNSTSFFNNSSFIQPLTLAVNDTGLNTQKAALTEISQQQLLVGPTTTNKLSANRKIYAPVSGNYVRLIDSVTNTSNTPIDVTVRLQGSYGIDELFTHKETFVVLEVDPQNNSNRYAMHRYFRNINTGEPFGPEDYPAVTAYVFASNTLRLPAVTDFQTARSRFSWQWSTTIPAGETMSFLSYVIVNRSESNDVATVTAIIDEIVNGTQVDMFNGLTAEERTNIVNFEVPQL